VGMLKWSRIPVCLVVCLCLLHAAGREARANDEKMYLDAVRKFADTVLEHGRDTYGEKPSPLFADGLHVRTLRPAVWKGPDQEWILSNLASQQPLLRTLDGLTALTGQEKYRRAAEDAVGYALEHITTPNGLLYWGGHFAWDLQGDRPVGQYSDVHELKNHQPYFRLMWRVNPAATSRLMEAIWAAHILDWSRLDYNRHASVKKPVRPQWDHAFEENLDVPFPAQGGNLSFVNVTPPLLHSGVMLAVLDENEAALKWTRRLLYRWQQAEHPRTGLSGGQLSYRAHDRAQDALGHVHPKINEAKIVASYHQTNRYHDLPLAQMQAALALRDKGGHYAQAGREFLQWACDDLKAYAQHSFDPNAGVFVAVTIDGTPLRWKESRSGYYVPQSFAPRRPDGFLFWGYALAYRLTEDELVRTRVYPPEGKQPTTARPTVRLEPVGARTCKLTVTCETEGAAIGFRRKRAAASEPNAAKDNTAWTIYNGPTNINAAGPVEVIAHRIPTALHITGECGIRRF